MDIKPGYKTTEFWLTILTTGVMVLVATGVIGQADADTINELGAELIAAVLPIALYIWSRTRVKSV